ncbi:Uma2 family endonuclease [Synechococcales cyanobacterium C]|uniref:Uma2 family endonuclease n=1 Tax=Petrachloros mirabilis ULC683 TaxID=2781853 RepID=A0A8K2A7Q8_9CYAN|nr:Uma2 family endonuclease [Petrachloros mirabilis]NCJ06340.1 Uma2 family endonuclease [Petrachloros mirabilis ULC683]
MVQTPTQSITQKAFEQLCLEHPTRMFERTAQGELVEVSPVGGEGSSQEADLITDVMIWNRQTKLGKVFSSQGAFRLPFGSIRAADVAWVRQERWEALTPEQQIGFPPVCPDFVIELRSQSIASGVIKPQSLPELRTKMAEYLASGLRLGWLINPQDQQVEIYRAGQAVQVVSMPTLLSGEAVLPGFELQV